MSTILLVEDDIDSVSLVEDIFLYDRIPARLITVGSAEEALHRAAPLQPVLILMDLLLPEIDGLEATKILKCDPLTKNIPVWAITANAMPGDKERALAAGCDEYFAKPMPMRTLADRLKEFIRTIEKRKRRQHASTQSADR